VRIAPVVAGLDRSNNRQHKNAEGNTQDRYFHDRIQSDKNAVGGARHLRDERIKVPFTGA
jgi:hypothetical protein